MSEVLSQSERFERWQARWTPEATAARAAEAAKRERLKREAERAESGPAELTLETLLAKLNFSREYAEHVVQPYCGCGDGHDGWDFCEHARDLGWPARDW